MASKNLASQSSTQLVDDARRMRERAQETLARAKASVARAREALKTINEWRDRHPPIDHSE